MKFRSEASSLIVWNPQKGKELCRFKNHELETNDKYIIDRLGDYEVIEDRELLEVSTHSEPERFIEGLTKSNKVEKPRKNKKKVAN